VFEGDEYSDDYGYCSHILTPYYFDYGGQMREYFLYLPDSLDSNAPLVFVMHGYGGTANSIYNYSKMNDVADEHGFAVCYPQGSSDQYNNNFWNVGYAFHDNQSVDDVGFLTSLADYLQIEFNLSADNSFSTGMSNGGDMSYMLACQAHDSFKAIAPVAGCMLESIYESCDSVPVPVLEIHGTDDDVTLWEGDMENNDGWGAYLSTLDGINHLFQPND
jgi:polyhydroxybutyrate depolymerase